MEKKKTQGNCSSPVLILQQLLKFPLNLANVYFLNIILET